MTLPVRERAFYGTAPLVEVISQLRFPKQLELQEAPPVEFQKALVKHYPFLETRDAISLQLAGLPDGMEFPKMGQRSVAYDFLDEARTTKITIASDFLAVSTTDYSRWEHFYEHLTRAITTFLSCYEVALFTRIGLRYQNVIKPAEVGLKRAPPSTLFAKEILGPMMVLRDRVREHQSVTEIGLGSGGAANLRFAASEQEGAARSYVLDCDVYTEQPTKADFDVTLGHLDRFHTEASNIFRWCIKERLHNAFKPEPC